MLGFLGIALSGQEPASQHKAAPVPLGPGPARWIPDVGNTAGITRCLAFGFAQIAPGWGWQEPLREPISRSSLDNCPYLMVSPQPD